MKKTLLTLAVLLVIVFAFAGCTVPENPSATPTPSEQPREVAIKAGDVYRYFHWNTMDENEPFKNSTRAEEEIQKWNDFQEKYGITIKYVKSPGGYYWQDLPLSAAASGEPICDIFCVGGPYVVLETVFYNNQLGNCVIPLDDYSQYATFDDPDFWDQGSQAACTFNGKLYCAVPQNNGAATVSSNTVTIFNQELLAKAGYSKEHLYQLSKDGQWDWDTFADAAVKCSEPDSNIYGTTLGDNVALGSALVVTNGGHYFERTQTGDVFVGNKTEAVEAWDFIVELANKNAVDTSGATENNSFGTGKVAMLVSTISRLEQIYNYLGFDYGIINPPKGPKANDYISEMNWFVPYSVMRGANNPAGAVQVLYEYFAPKYGINTPENQMLMESELSIFLPEQGSLDTALNITKYTSSENYFLYQTVSDGEIQMLSYLYGNVWKFISGEESPQIFYDSVEDKVNSLITSVQAKG